MRLISLCPSLTELLFDLGVGDELVGRTRFCIHPTDLVERVEKVGGTKNPRIERIKELAPDLVFMNEEENRREDADALRNAGIRVHSSMPRTPEDTAEMVRSIAAAVGRSSAGDSIARDIEQRAARVRENAAGQRTVRFVYLIWRRPWMTLNADTFVSTMLALAGGVNAFTSHNERYPRISVDDIRASQPDVVFLSTEPFPFEEKHIAELASLTGLAPERFRIVDGELLSWHGSRTPRGIDYAEQVIAAARDAGVNAATDNSA